MPRGGGDRARGRVDRLVYPPEPAVDHTQVVEDRGEARAELDRLGVDDPRLIEAVGRHVGVAQVAERLDELRALFDRLLVAGDRLRQAARRLQDIAEVVVGLREGPVHADRLGEGGERLVEATDRRQRHPVEAERLRVVGLDRQHRRVASLRLLEAAGLVGRGTLVQLRLCRRGSSHSRRRHGHCPL
jgi:hypothetical protein